MRILLIVALAVALSGCTESGRDAAVKNHAPGEAAEIKRSEMEAILDAILNDILNNPELKDTRAFYGTAEDRRVALVTNRGYGVPWPARYRPILAGWTVIRVEEGAEQNPNEPRLLGARIDKYSEKDKEQDKLFGSPVVVTILNAGGNKNGAVIGGCSVYYRPKQVGGKWVVQFESVQDP